MIEPVSFSRRAFDLIRICIDNKDECHCNLYLEKVVLFLRLACTVKRSSMRYTL